MTDPIFEKVSRPAEGSRNERPAASRPTTSKPELPAKADVPSADVKKAISTLGDVYSMLALGLNMAGANEAATLLAACVDDLQEKNARFLAKDKKLVALINKSGSVGGRGAFIIANAMVILPVAKIASDEIRAKFTTPPTEEGAE